MKSEDFVIILNKLYEDKKTSLELKDAYNLKLEEFSTITLQISTNAFLFVGEGVLLEETQRNLIFLKNAVNNLNSIYRTLFKFERDVLGFRFDQNKNILLTLYIKKINITFGDIDQYLILLKEFLNSDHKYELSDLEKKLTVSDMSLQEVRLSEIPIEDHKLINIAQLQKTTHDENDQWFCVHRPGDVYKFKNFHYIYAFLFKFVKEAYNYMKVQEEPFEILPGILEVIYISPEAVTNELSREFINSLVISQIMTRENMSTTNNLC